MPGLAARLCFLALLLSSAKAPLAVAQVRIKDSSSRSTINAAAIQTLLSKFDPNLKKITSFPFSIDNGDLRLCVSPGPLYLFDGAPYGNPPKPSLYVSPETSEKFFGAELIIHYALQRNGEAYGGLPIQERLTVLYENTNRFNPMRPRVLDTEPFIVAADGTFIDRQVLGNYGEPFPATVLQILKQELVLDNQLIAILYIARTPRDIRLIGYSLPPLLPASDNLETEIPRLSFGNLKKFLFDGSEGHYRLNGVVLPRLSSDSVELSSSDGAYKIRITFLKTVLVSKGRGMESMNQPLIDQWVHEIPLVAKILSERDPIGSLKPLIYELMEPQGRQDLELQEEIVLLGSSNPSEAEKIGMTTLPQPIPFSTAIADVQYRGLVPPANQLTGKIYLQIVYLKDHERHALLGGFVIVSKRSGEYEFYSVPRDVLEQITVASK